MKYIFRILAAVVAVAAVCSCAEKKPRVAIVGVGIECSTFSPARTTLDMFRPLYGEDIIKSYPFSGERTMNCSPVPTGCLQLWRGPLPGEW